MDINAAVQALIESNAALQLEVIYFNVFALSYRVCNYNSTFEDRIGLLYKDNLNESWMASNYCKI